MTIAKAYKILNESLLAKHLRDCHGEVADAFNFLMEYIRKKVEKEK